LFASSFSSIEGFLIIDFRPLSEVSGNKNYTVLEWLGIAREALNHRSYSCFIDLSKSDRENNKIFSPDTNGTKVSEIVRKKLNISEDIYSEGIVNLIFAGSFDESTLEQDFNDSFGWHGNDSYASLDINISDKGNITIVDSHQPNYIYEKYYLVDTAYAVARGEHVDISLCSDLNNVNVKKDNNTLYLFYNYRPWKGETFCGDKRNDANRNGNVTILMQDVTAFEAFTVDRTIRFKIDSYRNIRGTISRVHISKQKVVF